MKKVMLIFGTRPEAIKMAPLIKEINKSSELSSVICVTGQHRQMLDQVLNIFDIVPDYDLNIMTENQTLNDITCLVLTKLREVIDKENPDIVLVQGDTTSAFAGALAGFYAKKIIGHIEAGLRTYDKYSPYPEEMNRVMISKLADLHFCPTEENYNNLIKEHIDPKQIYITGNTVIDVFKYTIKENYTNEILDWVGEDKLIFFTVHRRENLGECLENIFKSINSVISKYKNVKLLYPVHLNPSIRELAYQYFDGKDSVKIVEPLNVVDCHNLLKRSSFVITDSGGIQEEAVSLNKKILILRDKTERIEGIENGNIIVGINNIDEYVSEMLNNENCMFDNNNNIYGDGTASEKIVNILKNI